MLLYVFVIDHQMYRIRRIQLRFGHEFICNTVRDHDCKNDIQNRMLSIQNNVGDNNLISI